jgi:hypothetical protein
LDETTPEAAKQDGVIVLKSNRRSKSAIQQAIKSLAGYSSVKGAGPLLECTDQTVAFLTDELIAQFNPDVTPSQITEHVKNLHLELVGPVPFAPNTWVFRSGQTGNYEPLDICTTLVDSGDVVYAEPNAVETVIDLSPGEPKDYLYPGQWEITQARVPGAWKTLENKNGSPAKYGSSDVVIAVFDRGIQTEKVGNQERARHPEFRGNVGGGKSKITQFYDFETNTPSLSAVSLQADNRMWHGTACASVATARADNAAAPPNRWEGMVGAAPGCRLLAVRRPLSYATALDFAYAYAWMAGIDTTTFGNIVGYPSPRLYPPPANPPADVITNSFRWRWGISNGLLGATMKQLVTKGRNNKGVVVLFGAGNGNTWHFDCLSDPNILAVSASTLAGGGPGGGKEVRASYSDFGDDLDFCAPSAGAFEPLHPWLAGIYEIGKHSPPQHRGVTAAVPVDLEPRLGPKLEAIFLYLINKMYGNSIPPSKKKALARLRVKESMLNMKLMSGYPERRAVLQSAANPNTGASSGPAVLHVDSTSNFSVGNLVWVGEPDRRPELQEVIHIDSSHNEIHLVKLERTHPAQSPVWTGGGRYYPVFGGCSSSCAYAGGIAALCMSANRNLTWDKIRDILRSTADKIDAGASGTGKWGTKNGMSYSRYYGYGRLNAQAAVKKASLMP